MPRRRSIARLKKKEYKSGAIHAMENAESLFKIAQFAHREGLNGNSVSLLITSLEELAKSAYLMIKAQHPDVVMTELDSFFYNHNTKHEAMVRLYNKLVITNVSELPKDEQNGAALYVAFAYGFVIYFLSKEGISFDIENIRKRGFYVDFNAEEGETWKIPNNLIDSDGLEKYLEVASNVINSVKKDLFCGKLSDVHTRKYLEQLNDQNVRFRKAYKFSDGYNPNKPE